MKAGWCFLLMLCLGCSQKEKEVSPAFYHWQTHLQLSGQEQSLLEQLKIQKLYVKFFDVDWDATRNQAVPLASLIADQLVNDSLEIVPVVFITNRTLVNMSEAEVATLSQQIHKKIKTIWRSFTNRDIREIQFDCDWTFATKEKYFSLLKHFREEDKKEEYQLSSTIRLHQIKFPHQTGIPPVDRGMLMFYNIGELENFQTTNSILNIELAKQYIDSKKEYALPLDIALPIFRWGVLFRNGELIKLINNLDTSDLKDTSRFKSLSANQYKVVKSTYLKGYYLYAADVIRLEAVSVENLMESAVMLNDYLSNNKTTVTLYHLDTTTIKHYTYEELQSVFQVFKK